MTLQGRTLGQLVNRRQNWVSRNPTSCFRILQTPSLNKKERMLNQYKMINIPSLFSWNCRVLHTILLTILNHSDFQWVFLSPLGECLSLGQTPPPPEGWCRAGVVWGIKSPTSQLWRKNDWLLSPLSISFATVFTESREVCLWTGSLFSSFECNCLDGSLWMLQLCTH